MFRKTLFLLLILSIPHFSFGADPMGFEEWKETRKPEIDRVNAEIKKQDEKNNLYRNDEYHFRIKFPTDWEIKDGDGEHIVKKAVKDNSTVMILANEDFLKFLLTEEELASLSDDDIRSLELNDLSDEDIKVFLENIIAEQLEIFPGSTILEKDVRYINNRKAAYFKMNQVYKVQNTSIESISINYFTIHRGRLYQIGGFYPTIPINETDKESTINVSLATFVFEDWEDPVSSTGNSSDSTSSNFLKEAINNAYGANFSNGGIFLLLAFSFVFTWILGLIIPILLRFVFLKRQVSKLVALAVVAVIYIIQLGIAVGLGSEGNHFALIIVAFVSYNIMRKGSKRNPALKYCKECGNKIHTSATICNKCGKKIA